MAWTKKLRNPGEYITKIGKWSVLGIIMGFLGGLLGVGFHHTLVFAAEFRGENPWLLWLLPLGGLLIVGIYKLSRLDKSRGTNEVIEAVLEGKQVSPLLAPVIFVATAITHILGGSAGREGAALQMGGSVASLLGRWFRLKEENKKILIMCGMGSVFAGLFGLPLTACLFTMEFEAVGSIFSPALLPCFLACFTAGKVAQALGGEGEIFLLEQAASTEPGMLWRYAVLAILLALLDLFMCRVFQQGGNLAKRFFPKPTVRIVVGGLLVIGLTFLVGDQRYSGAGMDMAVLALEGSADWQDFLLKMLFTAITLAAGFKGGEIVPTFCIGATFGCVAGGILGLDPGLGAALGLVGLFCGATNSPLASIVLGIEMFGGSNLHLFALICAISFVLSGHCGLYASQIRCFSMNRREDAVDN